MWYWAYFLLQSLVAWLSSLLLWIQGQDARCSSALLCLFQCSAVHTHSHEHPSLCWIAKLVAFSLILCLLVAVLLLARVGCWLQPRVDNQGEVAKDSVQSRLFRKQPLSAFNYGQQKAVIFIKTHLLLCLRVMWLAHSLYEGGVGLCHKTSVRKTSGNLTNWGNSIRVCELT